MVSRYIKIFENIESVRLQWFSDDVSFLLRSNFSHAHLLVESLHRGNYTIMVAYGSFSICFDNRLFRTRCDQCLLVFENGSRCSTNYSSYLWQETWIGFRFFLITTGAIF